MAMQKGVSKLQGTELSAAGASKQERNRTRKENYYTTLRLVFSHHHHTFLLPIFEVLPPENI